MSGRSLRHKVPVDYSSQQFAKDAWLKPVSGSPDQPAPDRKPDEKENQQAARGSGAAGHKEKPVATKGRNAGVTQVPIVDHKKKGGAAEQQPKSRKSGSSSQDVLAAVPTEPREVPGLPGVVQRAPAAGKGAAKRAQPSAGEEEQPAGKRRASGPSAADAKGKATTSAAAAPAPAADKPKPASSGGSGKSGRSKPGQGEAPALQPVQAPGKRVRKSTSTVAAVQQQQAQEEQAGQLQEHGAAAAQLGRDAGARSSQGAGAGKAVPAGAAGPQGAVAAVDKGQHAVDEVAVPSEGRVAPADMLQFEPVPGASAEELVEQFSENFRALQESYLHLQQQYEDLKSAKIDKEVEALLEQHNKYVTEHGRRAAELAEQWKQEAEQQAALAAEVGGEEALAAARRTQADLLVAQQALLDMEAAALEKDKRIVELANRVAFLERYARIPKVMDRCLQTDPVPQGHAALQAPSQQPSRSASGVEMLEARALAPEGVAGGSVYRQPRGLRHISCGTDAAPTTAAPMDASYSVPATTPDVHLQAAAAAAAAAGVSGSDMQLTAPAEEEQQQGQGQGQEGLQGGEVLEPVAGVVAHAAAARQVRPVAVAAAPAAAQRPGNGMTAESQMGKMQQQQQQVAQPALAAGAQQAQQQAQLERYQMQVRPSWRRQSAPPAPLARELQFSSVSRSAAPAAAGNTLQLLSAVPEHSPLASQQQQQPQQAPHLPPAAEGDEEPSLSHQVSQNPAASVLQQPAATAAAAATTAAAAADGEVTAPRSVPPPPRELAMLALTGLEATPMKGGIYRYANAATGFVFDLVPAPAETSDSEEGLDIEAEPHLEYRPVTLGSLAPALPSYLHSEIFFGESQRFNFMKTVMDAMARAKRAGQGQDQGQGNVA